MGLIRVARVVHTQHVRLIQTSTRVPLSRVLENGSEQPIQEGDLYRYQQYRSLRGESEKLAKRYRAFNLQGLIDVATNVAGSGSKCTKLAKCLEGQFNKTFLLSMDTGRDLVAKLPNPNAGPPFFPTASEVATRQYLREVLGVPIPRIYDWSSEKSNSVGAEYIIEEKASGIPLGRLWSTMSMKLQFHIIDQIVETERRLTSVEFSKHGCIYFQTDLRNMSQGYTPLHEVTKSTDSSAAPGVKAILSGLAVGPSNDPRLWDGERATMKLNRGPWDNFSDYAVSIGKNEIEWATLHANPRINFHRSLDRPETPEDYVSLLNRYLTIAPYIAMMEQPNRLAHPDLHLDNIFVDPERSRITCFIDWQRTSISPILLPRSFPQMLEITSGRTDEAAEKERKLQQYYFDTVNRMELSRREEHSNPCTRAIIDLISVVPGCWEQRNLFLLRNALIAVIARWEDITGNKNIPCPISFTEEELIQHQSETELIEGISAIVHQLQDEGLIPLGGLVRPSYYERANVLNEHFKREFIALAENERDTELHAKVWPYQ